MCLLMRCRCMSIEKRALLDHAERCRRVAGELAHRDAARRLQAMAEEYEARAASLDEASLDEASLKDGVQAKQDHHHRSYAGNGSARER